jgi:hypothetical protein
MTGKNTRCRTGECAWCGRHRERLIYTVYVMDGAYHAANVCERCLEEYRAGLIRTIKEGDSNEA